MARFSGKVAVITGASSGIGASLAREFAREGADVALLARRKERLESLAAELQSMGVKARAIPCDVTSDESVEQAVSEVRRELGRIDVVVANAGFGVTDAIEKLSPADYRRQFETNVFGVIRTVYATLADLKATRGHLVLVGSVMGHFAIPEAAPYTMSKYAVTAFAETLDYELRPKDVSVTLVSPGFISTEIRKLDRSGELKEGAKDIIPAWIQMPADAAARKIVRAVARGKRELVLTGHGKAAVFLTRYLLWAVRPLVRLAVRPRGPQSSKPVVSS